MEHDQFEFETLFYPSILREKKSTARPEASSCWQHTWGGGALGCSEVGARPGVHVYPTKPWERHDIVVSPNFGKTLTFTLMVFSSYQILLTFCLQILIDHKFTRINVFSLNIIEFTSRQWLVTQSSTRILTYVQLKFIVIFLCIITRKIKFRRRHVG